MMGVHSSDETHISVVSKFHVWVLDLSLEWVVQMRRQGWSQNFENWKNEFCLDPSQIQLVGSQIIGLSIAYQRKKSCSC